MNNKLLKVYHYFLQEINDKDYLDLLISKVTDLQKQISENIYVTDNSNAQGLNKIFIISIPIHFLF